MDVRVLVIIVATVFSGCSGSQQSVNAEETTAQVSQSPRQRASKAAPPVKLYPVVQSGRWGFVDSKGSMIVSPQFDRAWRYHEGRAAVQIGGKWGYLDETGKVIIEIQFDDALDFHDGLAAVKRLGKWGYIDRTGKTAIEARFDSAADFSEGLAAVALQVGKKEGYYIDKTGTRAMTLPGDVRQLGPFSEGLAGVWIGQVNGWGYIDRKGTVIIKPQFYTGESFREGLASVLTSRNLRGFVDKSGKMVIEGLSRSSSFSEGLALFQPEANGPHGYMNRDGKTVIVPQFDGGSDFSEGLAAVKVGNKWGYIDKSGRFVISAQFDSAEGFTEGLAWVKSGDTTGYVDKTARWVWRSP